MYPPQGILSRIVGGEDAEDGAAPFQCSMQSYKRHFCGCSVISEQWIATASHCVVGYDINSSFILSNTHLQLFLQIVVFHQSDRQSTKHVEILVGTNDLKNGGTYYKVEKFIAHNEYNRPQFANDIAVIKLQNTIQFNEKVKPIELMRDEVPDGAELELTGWGRLSVSLKNPLSF